LAEDGLEPDDPEHPARVVDIFISEWMGYFLLRESMLDSLVRAREKFLKPRTGLMFPSHCTMYVAPVMDEGERQLNTQEYSATMSDWQDFQETTKQVYGVEMEILKQDYDREQKDYYLYSSRWRELPMDAVLSQPKAIKVLDMMTCTIEDSKGIDRGDAMSAFDFAITGDDTSHRDGQQRGPISGLAGWFTADFKSRTDDVGRDTAPQLVTPTILSTGPEMGYTHWGQQVFYFKDVIRINTDLKQASGGKNSPKSKENVYVHLKGKIELQRTKENKRLYNVRLEHQLQEIIHSKNCISAGENNVVTRHTEVIAAVYKMI